MTNKILRCAGVTLVLFLIALAAAAQDFQRTYSVGPGARVSVRNVSGDIAVVGYDGKEVLAVAFKEGPDRDLVQIEDQSAGGAIALRVRYPENTRCDASVRFELNVPQDLELNFDSLSNASGNISVRDVRGTLRANTASGNVEVEQASGTVEASSASGNVTVQGAAGLVNAHTASGDVEVELVEQGGGREMKFSSASGNVSVKAPPGLDAEVQMSTASGSLRTNFPLTVEDRESGSGQKAHGRLGSGSCLLKLSTASGNVKLVH